MGGEEKKTNCSFSEIEALEKEMKECQDKLMEVCPLIPVSQMSESFVVWLKEFNEKNGRRQVRHLKRVRKYLEDRNLQIDDQITIRNKALKHWFHTAKGQKFIVLDEKFGYRYVANLKHDQFQHRTAHNNHNYHHLHHGQSQQSHQRPLNTLITDKELLRRIEFEYDKNSGEQMFCYPKTNDLMRLLADTVIDCIKTCSLHSNQETYYIFDCWVIGSKSLYKRNFIQRQEFCRILYTGYGSGALKFAGAVPSLQSIDRDCIKRNDANNIYLWFIRNKKSIEQNEKKNKKTANASQYWRPCSVKLWNGNKKDPTHHRCCSFGELLGNLRQLNSQQMQVKQRMQRHSTFVR